MPPDAAAATLTAAPGEADPEWLLQFLLQPTAPSVGGAVGVTPGSEQASAFPGGAGPSSYSPHGSLTSPLFGLDTKSDPRSPDSLPPSLIGSSEPDTARSEPVNPETPPPQNQKIPISRHTLRCCGREYELHALR